MSDPHVRTIGTVTDFDGMCMTVMVDYDHVRILGDASLSIAEVEQFAQLVVRATWVAAQCEAGHDGV
jgi:hypothetical protein